MSMIVDTRAIPASIIVDTKEFCAVMNAYREQIDFGSGQDMALDLATIVDQQRHPRMPAGAAREFVGEALGVVSSPA